LIPLFSAYSNVTQTISYVASNGTALSFTASFYVVYVSSTTYKVNVTDVLATKTYHTTVWLLKDGTVVGLQINKHNFNSTASASFQHYFGLWETELGLGQTLEAYTSSSFLTSTGTSMVTLGPSAFSVTGYALNVPSLTIQGCSGESKTLTTGSFSVGTPSGSSYPLVTTFDAAGSETTLGNYTFTGSITWVAVA
jgi:hypothetical protein